MKVAVVSTYPPRECGLATFAADLCGALLDASVGEVGMVALTRAAEPSVGPPTATRPTNGVAEQTPDQAREQVPEPQPRRLADIRDESPGAYENAAAITNDWADVVVVQHEFGIFGGPDGSYLLTYLRALRVPFVLTLHTVLPTFSESQRAVLREACDLAAAVTVFTPTAQRLLAQQHIAEDDEITVVPHGAPSALYAAERTTGRRRFGVRAPFLISSFGLLSEGKGLELGIEALDRCVRSGVDAELIIAGATHPDIRRRDGERYRDRLRSRAAELGLADRVTFVEGFLRIEEIAALLAATDVFITPYVGGDQIVSGALTFALAAGCAVVSTRYAYAVDQLSSGAGILVDDRDPDTFAAALTALLTDEQRLASARAVARSIGASMTWSSIGRQIADLCASCLSAIEVRHALARASSPAVPAPAPLIGPAPLRPSTLHLQRLVDSRGIVQHATGMIPRLSTGYCVDDVARLAPVAVALAEEDPAWDRIAARSVAFLEDAMVHRSALMHNFMDAAGAWIDAPHFGDHVGRTLMGLAAVASWEPAATLVEPLMTSVVRHWPSRPPLHPDALALIALSRAPQCLDRPVAHAMITRLRRAYSSNMTKDWCWPESTIRYEQARFPHALMAAGDLLGDDTAVEIGLRSLAWYTARFDHGTYLRFPGHRGLAPDGLVQRSGDEQPLEALAFIEAHLFAFTITGDREHLEHARKGRAWFDGANRLAVPLHGPGGACFDGLGSIDVNHNAGAESTLALHQADAALRPYLDADTTARSGTPPTGQASGATSGQPSGTASTPAGSSDGGALMLPPASGWSGA